MTDLELINTINKTEIQTKKAAFWWLGQQSYIVKTCKHILYFDPFLSPHPHRKIPSLLQPSEVTNADFIFGSHDHKDHIDREALPGMMNASLGAKLVVPKKASLTLPKAGISENRLIIMDNQVSFQQEEIKITAIPAAHEFFDYDKNTGYPHLQYLVESGGVTIYHAGDTLRYEGMISKLQQQKIDLAFLPINGRDGERLARNCQGNMTYQEAVDLAGEIKPHLTIPGHYEMFANNSENPQLFANYMKIKYPKLQFWFGKHGEVVLT